MVVVAVAMVAAADEEDVDVEGAVAAEAAAVLPGAEEEPPLYPTASCWVRECNHRVVDESSFNRSLKVPSRSASGKH